jgi:hypothetical protein
VSQGNGNKAGPLRLGRHGKKVMQYDEGYEEVLVDLVAVANELSLIDRQFILPGETPALDPERLQERTAALTAFARAVLKVPEEDAHFSAADALHFQTLILEEATKLRPLFERSSSGESPSPGRSRVTYSD